MSDRKGREALISGDGNKVHLSLPSDVTADTLDAFVQANVELLKAVANEMGEPDLKVTFGNFRIVCDGCGAERPAGHEAWTQTATGHDYCAGCQVIA